MLAAQIASDESHEMDKLEKYLQDQQSILVLLLQGSGGQGVPNGQSTPCYQRWRLTYCQFRL